MYYALDCYLKEAGYQYSVQTSRNFMQSRSAYEGKAKLLKEESKGKRPNSLSDNEVKKR